MAKTFFFYDLETSGLNPREDRIMQFAGQRTDTELNPVGEAFNLLVRLDEDTLPAPEALMVTGITPQKTVEEGYSEAEFSKILIEEVFTPDTIAVGFNSVRFDDEFVRHLLWRNFYDPYEWSWKDGRSRWDILDVVRMTRALRPEGIIWPLDGNGEPSNRLELLTKANSIAHEGAHDALSDVKALIAVTRLLKKFQPQLFSYLLEMRDKNAVKSLVSIENKQPFVYTSGRYDKQFAKTTVAYPLAPAPNNNILVYDLRYDPTPFMSMSLEQLSQKRFASWQENQQPDFIALPIKQLQYNRCPAVAPIGVLTQHDGWQLLQLDQAVVKKHLDILLGRPEFSKNIQKVYEELPEYKANKDPEAMLYDGFISDGDKVRVEAVRRADDTTLTDMKPSFKDERLAPLFIHYKARNFPHSLDDAERSTWEEWRQTRLQSQLPVVISSLQKLLATDLSDEKQFILAEIHLWIEGIMPAAD